MVPPPGGTSGHWHYSISGYLLVLAITETSFRTVVKTQNQLEIDYNYMFLLFK